jgi:oligopeptide transport system ATP-binding protein
MAEIIRIHQRLERAEAREKAIHMLTLVGIPNASARIREYPHQFSGGMLQRVLIAMAMSCNAEILIADEPTSALDVTIQAQILELMKRLTREFDTSVIVITHDLGVVAGVCDEICVMYAGRIVEQGSADDIFHAPKHPYTRGLIRSVPRLDVSPADKLYSIEGQPPNPVKLPPGCAFHPRCSQAMDICRKAFPPVRELGVQAVRCWLYEEGASVER